MEDRLEDIFIEQINQNIGIAHKVCNIYFNDLEERADVLQEMLYQLWKGYSNFREQSKFSTWMYTVCFNTAITYFKKNKRSRDTAANYNQYSLVSELDDDYEEKLLLLHKLIEDLSALNKSIILLYMEGVKYEEISAITGLSKTNVSVRLVRIKNQLKIFKQQTI
jgi:RNA polymerase sigma-70 factor (ECF subfamily)